MCHVSFDRKGAHGVRSNISVSWFPFYLSLQWYGTKGLSNSPSDNQSRSALLPSNVNPQPQSKSTSKMIRASFQRLLAYSPSRTHPYSCHNIRNIPKAQQQQSFAFYQPTDTAGQLRRCARKVLTRPPYRNTGNVNKPPT